jgi:hypothetical protein
MKTSLLVFFDIKLDISKSAIAGAKQLCQTKADVEVLEY